MNPVPRADRLQLRLPITYRAQGYEEWLLSRVVNLSESGVLFGPTGLSAGPVFVVILSPAVLVGVSAPGPQLRVGEENIYLRFGDTVVVTDTGVENFTDFIPMELDDMERIVGEQGIVQQFPPVAASAIRRGTR